MDSVARGIMDHQDELSPDLIIMCTHGRSGLKDMLFGRIAQQVVASGKTPVLLIPARGATRSASFTCRTILAPTDGKPAHEPGLKIAVELAHATGARLLFLGVVPTVDTLAGRHATSGRFMPGTTRAVLELAEEELESYLQEECGRSKALGVVSSASVRRGDPASIILEAATNSDADVIVLGTHGKAGASAFWAHSVSAEVLGKTTTPLLLIPVPPEEHS
jgi:nucleotide-binding universal stress UspA family protein